MARSTPSSRIAANPRPMPRGWIAASSSSRTGDFALALCTSLSDSPGQPPASACLIPLRICESCFDLMLDFETLKY